MSLPQYPEYKDSGHPHISKVPSQWEIKPLKHCLRLITEKATGKSSPIALENIEGWSARYLPSESDFEGVGIAFRQGDILFGKLRPYLAKVYQAEFSGEAIGDFHVMRPVSGFIGRYALYQFLQESFISVVDGATHGAKMPRVGWEFMGNMPFVVPRPEEQLQIARFLSHETAKIDALIREQERLIELLQEKRQAVISHAVTKGLDPDVPMKDSGVQWLGEVPAHWDLSHLKQKWSVIDCKHVTANFVDDGYPLASIREVQTRFVDLSSANKTTQAFYDRLIGEGREPRPGDLIISRNATVGEVSEVTSDHPSFALGQDVCLLRRNEANMVPAYLYYTIKSNFVGEQINALMVGSTFKRINVEQIKHLLILTPPSNEQLAISHYIDGVSARYEALATEATAGASILKERRSALISAAVTGKIDVRNWQPPADESAFDEEVRQAGMETTA